MTDPVQIRAGRQVRMHFSLALAEGIEAVSTFAEEPLEFRLGDGTLLPALEENLLGLTAGTRQTLLLTPEHAYGARDESLVHTMPRDEFGETPEKGQVIAFSLPNGQETPGTVIDVEENDVRVDFNHPLAGRNLVFRVEILSVNDPGTPTP